MNATDMDTTIGLTFNKGLLACVFFCVALVAYILQLVPQAVATVAAEQTETAARGDETAQSYGCFTMGERNEP